MYKVVMIVMGLSIASAEGSLAKKPDTGVKHERKKSTLSKEQSVFLAKTLGAAVFTFENDATKTDDQKKNAEKFDENGDPFSVVAKKGGLTVPSTKHKSSTPNTSPVSKKG